MELEIELKKAAEAIKLADAIFITAGAGIGVDSGLPDFRGNEGFWKAYPPIAKLGYSFTDMANPKWFKQKPELAWAFYGHRQNLYRETKPHFGFNQLLELGNSKKYGYFIYTSNVDGQFQKAGFAEGKIKECHGSIHHLQCTQNCSQNIWSAKDENVIVNMEVFEAQNPLPKCPKCGALARPNILMFNDWEWESARADRQAVLLNDWLKKLLQNNAKLVIIELGAGTEISTVRHKSQQTIRKLNATLIRINPRDYDVPANQISIALGSAEGMKRIVNLL